MGHPVQVPMPLPMPMSMPMPIPMPMTMPRTTHFVSVMLVAFMCCFIITDTNHIINLSIHINIIINNTSM